jgi:hypothetical protein
MARVTKFQQTHQPWIYSKSVDGFFILGPAFLSTLAIIFFHEYFVDTPGISPIAWLLLVLGVDVAHVYSSWFRLRWDAERDRRKRSQFLLISLLAWVIGVGLYAIDGRLFWSCLAYLAVYHFIRQQYGFMMVYARKDIRNSYFFLDRCLIYMATLYPLVYWHTHLPRNFTWLIEGDFFSLSSPLISEVCGYIYGAIVILYVIKEVRGAYQSRAFNVPKNLIILGTCLSWYIGIVVFNGDLAFTAINVLSHGIPYIALIWIYGRRHEEQKRDLQSTRGGIFTFRTLPVYLGGLVLLAYIEEGFWDGLVWKDHAQYFPGFRSLPEISAGWLLTLIIPLLALPQFTHYIFDGLLWRVRRDDGHWKSVLFAKRSER